MTKILITKDDPRYPYLNNMDYTTLTASGVEEKPTSDYLCDYLRPIDTVESIAPFLEMTPEALKEWFGEDIELLLDACNKLPLPINAFWNSESEEVEPAISRAWFHARTDEKSIKGQEWTFWYDLAFNIVRPITPHGIYAIFYTK